MSTFRVGQRVRTTVDAPSAWEGGFSAPAGTPGIITLPDRYGGYGVILDGGPHQLPADYSEDELTPEDPL
ncbi:hypothetical protein ACIQ9J_01470 [Streptomyces sp. NPDC094153]|uniref:hypothetical protein n=1 Tax=Streptomyces sp. NPDC094153 TaxID=3366058 RepID=UPI0037F99DAE